MECWPCRLVAEESRRLILLLFLLLFPLRVIVAVKSAVDVDGNTLEELTELDGLKGVGYRKVDGVNWVGSVGSAVFGARGNRALVGVLSIVLVLLVFSFGSSPLVLVFHRRKGERERRDTLDDILRSCDTSCSSFLKDCLL